MRPFGQSSIGKSGHLPENRTRKVRPGLLQPVDRRCGQQKLSEKKRVGGPLEDSLCWVSWRGFYFISLQLGNFYLLIFICLKGRETPRDPERSPICWFTFQMLTTTRAMSGHSQEHGTQSGALTWLPGTQVFQFINDSRSGVICLLAQQIFTEYPLCARCYSRSWMFFSRESRGRKATGKINVDKKQSRRKENEVPGLGL